MNNRERYIRKLEGQIHQWEGKLVELQGKAKQVEAKMKVEFEGGIDDLRKKIKEAQQKLQTAKDTGNEVWKEIEEKAVKNWNDLKTSTEKIISKYLSH